MYGPVNLCIKREVFPNKGIPLPRCSNRSPETPPKFAAPPDVEKCHFRATPIWIMGKFRDFQTFDNISHLGYQTKALHVRNHKNVFIWNLGSYSDHAQRPHPYLMWRHSASSSSQSRPCGVSNESSRCKES